MVTFIFLRNRSSQIGGCFFLMMSLLVLGCSSGGSDLPQVDGTASSESAGEGFAPSVASNGTAASSINANDNHSDSKPFNPLAVEETENPASNSQAESEEADLLKRQVAYLDRENLKKKEELAALNKEKIDSLTKRLNQSEKKSPIKPKIKKEEPQEFDIAGLQKLAGAEDKKNKNKDKERKRARRVSRNRLSRSGATNSFVPAAPSGLSSPFYDAIPDNVNNLRNMLSGSGGGSSFGGSGGGGNSSGTPPHDGSAGGGASSDSGVVSETTSSDGISSQDGGLEEVDFGTLMGLDFAGMADVGIGDEFASSEELPHEMDGEIDDFGGKDFSGPGEGGLGMPPHEDDPLSEDGQPGGQGDGPHQPETPPAGIETVKPPIIDF